MELLFPLLIVALLVPMFLGMQAPRKEAASGAHLFGFACRELESSVHASGGHRAQSMQRWSFVVGSGLWIHVPHSTAPFIA